MVLKSYRIEHLTHLNRGKNHGQRKRYSENRKEKIRKNIERKAQRKKVEKIKKRYHVTPLIKWVTALFGLSRCDICPEHAPSRGVPW
jgi:hypothetical protein